MNNTDKAHQMLKLLGDAICETICESPNGAPGGHLYAALMTYGMGLETFEAIMAALVTAGKVIKRGDCYYAAGGTHV